MNTKVLKLDENNPKRKNLNTLRSSHDDNTLPISMFHGDVVNEYAILYANWAFNQVKQELGPKKGTKELQITAMFQKIIDSLFASAKGAEGDARAKAKALDAAKYFKDLSRVLVNVPIGVEITGSTREDNTNAGSSDCFKYCFWKEGGCKRNYNSDAPDRMKTNALCQASCIKQDPSNSAAMKAQKSVLYKASDTGAGTTQQAEPCVSPATTVASYRVDFDKNVAYYSMQFHPEITQQFTDFRYFKPKGSDLFKNNGGGARVLEALGITSKEDLNQNGVAVSEGDTVTESTE
jgi:hypothetical protein